MPGKQISSEQVITIREAKQFTLAKTPSSSYCPDATFLNLIKLN